MLDPSVRPAPRALAPPPLVLLALLAVLPGAWSEEGGALIRSAYGFEIGHPDGWGRRRPDSTLRTLEAMELVRASRGREASVTVYVTSAPASVTDAEAARRAVQATWERDLRFRDLTRGDAPLAGGRAPWIQGVYSGEGRSYAVRQHFVTRAPYVYIVQCASGDGAFDEDAEIQELLGSFRLLETDDARLHLETLAARCGSEIPWASTWAEASERAEREGRLVLVVFEVYRGMDLPRIAPSTLFMDEDVVELAGERLVVLAWTDATNTPLDDPAVYGLGASTFGQGVLFATPDGRVVGDALYLQPVHVYERALEALARHPGASPRDAGDVDELLRRGDLDEAAALLAAPTTGAAWRQRAGLHRKRREGEAALEALQRARALGETGTDVEAAILRFRLGELDGAARDLERSEDPRGRFYRCVAVALRRGFDAARGDLEALVADDPESRFAWRAAAFLLGHASGQGIDTSLWPAAAQAEAWRAPGYERSETLDAAIEGAIGHLLERQQEGGTWSSPRTDASRSTTLAITAICAESLLPYRERPAVRQAVERALSVVRVAKPEPRPSGFDFAVWARIYGVRLLAACVDAGVGPRGPCRRALGDLVGDLDRYAEAQGGWSYLASRGLGGNPAGFTTAAACLALSDARRAGAEVGEASLSKAYALLEALSLESGAFAYMPATADRAHTKEAEASLRSPLYALALHQAGRAAPQRVKKALDIYLRHREHVRKERGKPLCHTGPEGTASYYLLFGYAYAAEALQTLPPAERAPYARALLDDVLHLRLQSGAFCDNPAIGSDYGTAMALRTLHLLRE